MSLNSVYTPQIIVNGVEESVGNKRTSVERILALQLSKGPEKLKVNVKAGAKNELIVEIEPARSSNHSFITNIALTADGITSRVTRGENEGRILIHDNVVLKLISKPSSPAAFSNRFVVPIDSYAASPITKVVVFLQEPGPGRIFAAGAALYPKQ